MNYGVHKVADIKNCFDAQTDKRMVDITKSLLPGNNKWYRHYLKFSDPRNLLWIYAQELMTHMRLHRKKYIQNYKASGYEEGFLSDMTRQSDDLYSAVSVDNITPNISHNKRNIVPGQDAERSIIYRNKKHLN